MQAPVLLALLVDREVRVREHSPKAGVVQQRDACSRLRLAFIAISLRTAGALASTLSALSLRLLHGAILVRVANVTSVALLAL